MKRGLRPKFIWLGLGLLCAIMLLAGSAWTIHAAWDQDSKNAGLITAIRRNDPDAVRLYLARGANPEARENLAINGSILARLKAFVFHQGVAGKEAEAVSEGIILNCTLLRNPPHAPVPDTEWQKMMAIYEMIGEAKCRHSPKACHR